MPFWIAVIACLVKIVLAIGFMLTAVPMLVYLERKLIADFQARVGPNRVGPFGVLQSFADGIKLVMKESIRPSEVDKLLYYAAPVLCMIPALSVAAVVPFGPPTEILGHVHSLVIADLPVGFLFVLALTSLGVYGIVLSGWASTNKYSLLGGLRSSAQMVSYELPMGFCVIAGLMIASHSHSAGLFSLKLSDVVAAQAGKWGVFDWTAFNPRFMFLGFFAMLGFYICGLAETNRAPFDLAEAETELTGGYHTEYGGLKWAMFFLGEYAAMLNIAAVTTTLFLGGWLAPYPGSLFPANSIPAAMEGMFWFAAKVGTIIVIYIHLRATLPRLRYDQLMGFTWKRLLPLSLLNVLLVGGILTALYREEPPGVLTRPVGAPPPGTGAPKSPSGAGAADPHGGLGMNPAAGMPGMSTAPSTPPGSSPTVPGAVAPSKPGAP